MINDEALILRFPDEIFLLIFRNFSASDLSSIAMVCRRFRVLSNDEHLWFYSYKQRWKIPSQLVFSQQESSRYPIESDIPQGNSMVFGLWKRQFILNYLEAAEFRYVFTAFDLNMIEYFRSRDGASTTIKEENLEIEYSVPQGLLHVLWDTSVLTQLSLCHMYTKWWPHIPSIWRNYSIEYISRLISNSDLSVATAAMQVMVVISCPQQDPTSSMELRKWLPHLLKILLKFISLDNIQRSKKLRDISLIIINQLVCSFSSQDNGLFPYMQPILEKFLVPMYNSENVIQNASIDWFTIEAATVVLGAFAYDSSENLMKISPQIALFMKTTMQNLSCEFVSPILRSSSALMLGAYANIILSDEYVESADFFIGYKKSLAFLRKFILDLDGAVQFVDADVMCIRHLCTTLDLWMDASWIAVGTDAGVHGELSNSSIEFARFDTICDDIISSMHTLLSLCFADDEIALIAWSSIASTIQRMGQRVHIKERKLISMIEELFEVLPYRHAAPLTHILLLISHQRREIIMELFPVILRQCTKVLKGCLNSVYTLKENDRTIPGNRKYIAWIYHETEEDKIQSREPSEITRIVALGQGLLDLLSELVDYMSIDQKMLLYNEKLPWLALRCLKYVNSDDLHASILAWFGSFLHSFLNIETQQTGLFKEEDAIAFCDMTLDEIVMIFDDATSEIKVHGSISKRSMLLSNNYMVKLNNAIWCLGEYLTVPRFICYFTSHVDRIMQPLTKLLLEAHEFNSLIAYSILVTMTKIGSIYTDYVCYHYMDLFMLHPLITLLYRCSTDGFKCKEEQKATLQNVLIILVTATNKCLVVPANSEIWRLLDDIYTADEINLSRELKSLWETLLLRRQKAHYYQ